MHSEIHGAKLKISNTKQSGHSHTYYIAYHTSLAFMNAVMPPMADISLPIGFKTSIFQISVLPRNYFST